MDDRTLLQWEEIEAAIATKLFGTAGYRLKRNEMAEADHAVPLPFSSDVLASATLKAELRGRGIDFVVLHTGEEGVWAFKRQNLGAGHLFIPFNTVMAPTEEKAICLLAKQLLDNKTVK